MPVGSALPATFASSRASGVSHVVTKNELEARLVRQTALEVDALRIRDLYSQKYQRVSPRVLPKVESPRCNKGTVELQPSDTLDEEIAARLLMPPKPHNGQLLCVGGESRKFDRDEESTIYSTWDRLNVSKKVIASHDLFLTTAGRVKPYLVVTDHTALHQSSHPGISRVDSGRHHANRTTDGNTRTSPHRGVRKGLAVLKDSSSSNAGDVFLPSLAQATMSARNLSSSRKHTAPQESGTSNCPQQPHSINAAAQRPLQPITESTTIPSMAPLVPGVDDDETLIQLGQHLTELRSPAQTAAEVTDGVPQLQDTTLVVQIEAK